MTSQSLSVHCVSQLWTISFLNIAEYQTQRAIHNSFVTRGEMSLLGELFCDWKWDESVKWTLLWLEVRWVSWVNSFVTGSGMSLSSELFCD